MVDTPLKGTTLFLIRECSHQRNAAVEPDIYIFFSNSQRLTHRLAARSKMTVIQSHVAEMKRRTVFCGSWSLENETIKATLTTPKLKADGTLIDPDWALFFLFGHV